MLSIILIISLSLILIIYFLFKDLKFLDKKDTSEILTKNKKND